MTLGNKLLAVFVGDEVLTLQEVAKRSGYGNSTVTCYLPQLVTEGRLWRVAHGRYSLSPRASDAIYTQKEKVLAAFRVHSFNTSAWVRKHTGLSTPIVAQCVKELARAGQLHKIRRGVYSASLPQ